MSELAMWGYVSHYLFIVVGGVYIVRPLELTVLPGFFVLSASTLLMVVLTFALKDMMCKKNPPKQKLKSK